MSWRSLMITNPSRLSREHGSLVVEQGEGRDRSKVTIPFEDIALILLDHREISLTHSVLSSCGDCGIVLISTGATHHPNGAFLPYLPHSHQGKWLHLQMGLSRVVAKQLWSRIVAAKIANQATCLRLAEREGEERLLKLIPQIKAGDGGNLEATAAHLYFRFLFGESFTRGSEVFANAALNYGYAVVRAAIARGLVAHGLLPTLGLFHASQQNAFNLADDLIEPFRPLVDLQVSTMVAANLANGVEPMRELETSDKARLVGLVNTDMEMPEGKMSCLSAIEFSVRSLARAIEDGDSSLIKLPKLVGLEQHQAE